jgi:hypothetical protein
MVSVGLGRRAFVEGLVGIPLGGVAPSAQTSPSSIVKVAAGSGRARRRRRELEHRLRLWRHAVPVARIKAGFSNVR